jgi:Helix-turn-helix domain
MGETPGKGVASPTPSQPHARRTATDGFAGDYNGKSPKHAGKAMFNFGRHRWLGQVARDSKLSGAALRVAVLLWQYQNDERGCAWPSLERIASELKMHKSTVVRSLQVLRNRDWISVRHRCGRHRTNEYRMAFGSLEDEETLTWQLKPDYISPFHSIELHPPLY